MKWNNLKLNKCPNCSKDLIIGMEETTGGYIYCACGFKITPKRMKEIVTSQVSRDVDKYFDERDKYRRDKGYE